MVLSDPETAILGPPKMAKNRGNSLERPLGSGAQVEGLGRPEMVPFHPKTAILGPLKVEQNAQNRKNP